MSRRDKAGGKAIRVPRRKTSTRRSAAVGNLRDQLDRRTRELNESREQQAATLEVLKVISSSPGDLARVFDAILERATRLCEATHGHVWRFDGEWLHVAAVRGDPQFVEWLHQHSTVRPIPGSAADRIVRGARFDHMADRREESAYRDNQTFRGLVDTGGIRASLTVALRSDETLLGMINVYRQEIRPFTDKQIALVENFAAQAVIAIENTRLLNEQRELLERQIATSEVLQVISTSPGELGPVYETILAKATRICGARFGTFYRCEGDALRCVAMHGAPQPFAEERRRNPVIRPGASTTLGRALATKRPVQIDDVRDEAQHGDSASGSTGAQLAKFADARTVLAVPMLKDAELIGAIVIYRQEVRPFTDKQIELVKNFASQAVIAIENTRLLNELRQRTDDLSESLEQQTATSEVLKVISSSTGDLQPIFQAMLENATRLCAAKFGLLYLRENDAFCMVAHLGTDPAYLKHLPLGPFRPGPETLLAQVERAEQVVQIEDLRNTRGYAQRVPIMVAAAELGGVRTFLGVPMIKDGALAGAILLYRQEVRPFTEKQIELVKNFAAQAVIAIENTRLLNELRESLQQQTATADVLKVISRSAFNLQTVLDTLVESAVHLCEADSGILRTREGDIYPVAATCRLTEQQRDRFTQYSTNPDRGSLFGRAILGGRTIHVSDVLADPEYDRSRQRDPVTVRAGLAVPMMREGTVVGVVTLQRKEPRPFSDSQIQLVTTFADQAVIAIENVRLFDEVQARTRELSESLQQQTATADVLKVISSSPGDLEPVFQAMLEKATQLCEAKFGVMFRFANGVFRATSWLGNPPAHIIEQPHVVSENPHNLLTCIVTTKQPVYSSDLTRERAYIEGNPRIVALVETAGARSLLVVPMVKKEELIGAIAIYWQEARLFTEKQMELISNFAAQAVIAIDNTRLLSELRESLQQQTATADVLKVISRSTFDLQTVLNTLAESAARLCEADQSYLLRPVGDNYVWAASHGFSQGTIEFRKSRPLAPDRGTIAGRAVVEGKIVHIPDVLEDAEYKNWDRQKAEGFRTLLGVPLLREGVPMGVFGLTRLDPKPFTDKQIELATTFADQAAIAIENVRLFESVEARTRELAKSLEELRTTQDRLVQTQKLALLGQLTAGIAHEIKNPLNFVNNFSGISTELIDELQDTLKGIPLDDKARTEINELTDTLKSNFDKVVHHGRRADAIVKNMLQHSREGSGDHRMIDINALVEESLNLAWHGARAETQGFEIKLKQAFDPSAGGADVFPQDIRRALLNLIANGFYAATKRRAETNSGGYAPTLTASTRNLGDRVQISIRDNGIGIMPDVKEKMFEPFFTTKPTGEGTGLGLSISHDIIVKQHAGTIEVDTKPGEGTEIRIILPRTPAFV